jgi:8-oxo-dGTP diphosphatase
MGESQFWIGVHAIIADGGRLVVLRRAARMPYRPGHWDLPGGHLSLGESFEECLAREVGEETGLSIEIERALGLYKAPPDPYVQALFACRPADARRELTLMPGEHVEGRWVTLEQLARLSDVIPYLEGMLRRGMLDYLKWNGRTWQRWRALPLDRERKGTRSRGAFRTLARSSLSRAARPGRAE